MERAGQTKTKAKAPKIARTIHQAAVRIATGSGNSYTQNICLVEEQELERSINCYEERTAKFVTETQNNQTEIKISQYKSQKNHLKFLQNLFLKLILCISEVNKSILKILKTTANYTCYNNAPKCIINSPQQQQEQNWRKKVECLKPISFKFKIVKKLLTQFHRCCSRKNLEKDIKLFVIKNNKIRHFAGICLKRLISLKRLQQIPEKSHANVDEESLQIKARNCNYRYLKQELNQINDPKLKLVKESKLNSESCQVKGKFKESFKALLSLQEQRNGKDFTQIQDHKNCQPCVKACFQKQEFNEIKVLKDCQHENNTIIKTHKNSDELLDIQPKSLNEIIPISTKPEEFKNQNYIKKYCQQNLYNHNHNINNFPKSKQLLNSYKDFLRETRKIYHITEEDYSYSRVFVKFWQLNKPGVSLQLIVMNKGQTNAATRLLVENYKSLNKTKFELEQLTLQPFGEKYKLLTIPKNREIQYFLPNSMDPYGHVNEREHGIRFYIGLSEEECSILGKQQNFKIECLITNCSQKCGQLIKHRVVLKRNTEKVYQIRVYLAKKFQKTLKKEHEQLTKPRYLEIQEFLTNSSEKSGQLNKHRTPLKIYTKNEHSTRYALSLYLKYIIVPNFQRVRTVLKEKCSQFITYRVSLPYYIKLSLYIESENMRNIPKKCDQLQKSSDDLKINISNKKQEEIKLQSTNGKYGFFPIAHENTNNFITSPAKQLKWHKKCCYINGFRRRTSLSFINEEEEMELASYANIVRQFQLDDNNNSHQIESKQQKFLKKCQHILYSILFYYCCFCYWHIYGFPLVLEQIFKYLKDATVHVLTRRLKITTTAIVTSMCYNYGNIKVAFDGKLKKPTEDYKDNQQNVLKRQTLIATTTTNTSCAYSSSSCLTTSLTASSSYFKSVESLMLLPQQPQQLRQPYCHYQQYHHQEHHHHHHYQHNQLKQKRQQLQQQKPQQQYNSNSTILRQLPSLLVFSRTLIIVILLSSLWHTSEGFHGSGVKLSTNTVKTKYGLVRGIVVRTSPTLVEAYLGIPYASPPVGSLRFMPPITPSTWKNVRNADRYSPVCPQNVPIPPNGPEALLEVPRARLAQLRRLLPLLSNQSEDCLYLNIYVPYANRRNRRFTTNSSEINDTPKLPAILFIHGESYEWNSGNPYDGSELAAHGNVIVVTINFRLGILGFLKTGGKESAQGNFGLMDLVAGLHWLKENLPAFGGDPQQITLLGHGTGAALANILVVSPVASDLVQHTVLVSGSAISPWAIQKNPLFVKRRVAEQTGCHGDMLYYDLAPCLRTKTVTELLAVKIDHPRFLVGFAPFIDGTVISPNADSIGKLSLPLGSAIVSTSGIEYANFPKRNLIFCLTSVESHLDLSAQDLEFGFNETRRDRILRTYVRNNFHYHLNEIFAVLKNEYTEWDKAIRSPLSSRDATLQFLSDGHTASSLIKLGFMHSLRGGKGFFLHFKHRTVEEEYPQRTGSVRGEDVPFWLGLPISPLFPHNYTTQEKQISRLMLRYLANFAKTGNPNQSSTSSLLPSSSSLIGAPHSSLSSTSSSLSSQAANDNHEKIKRSSFNIVNATSLTNNGPNIVEDVVNAAAREALNLAVLYNQRRTKRTYYNKRHSRSNDDHSGSASSEVNYFLSTNTNNNKLDSDEQPFWDAYDIVNQLYMELGNKAEIQSHYRGHKLSMWLNLIPQLHRHANMNDQSMRHHQFQDDLNNLNLYEGIVRAQIPTKPDDDDENLLLPRGRPNALPPVQETNITQKSQGATTECGVDGAMFVAEMTTVPPNDNRSLVLDSREKEMATASTGLIGNLEVLRRLSGKQFHSYTTALVATVAVGCFLLILNILIFAGIYHQREKRARDAKTKEELQDNDTSKNSSMLKLNAMGSETGSFNGHGADVSGKTTVVFGEYSCYDEKSLHTKDEKLIVELPAAQMVDVNWAACSTSTLDLLKTKHHTPLDTTYTLGSVVPINTESQTERLMPVNNLEMATYNTLPMASGLLIDSPFAATSSAGLLSKRGSFVGSTGQLNQYDFASVQSSDQMSFKDIENAVKASAAMNDDITQDDDIPEPPPPPRSFHSIQQQPQQAATNAPSSASGSGGGGILRQAGTTSATQTGGSKKRVHIQEISV